MELLALWLGKLLIALLRLAGREGSTLPGRVAARLDPDVLAWLGRRTAGQRALVTGTNGKTTTSALLARMLAWDGARVTHNRSGANLLPGVTTAFLGAAGWSGAGAGRAVCEVDEATLPRAAASLAPQLILVTNFFRDQLDRFGELARTVGLVREGLAALPAGATLVLNADDPLAASLGDVAGLRVVYFGLACSPPEGGEAGAAAAADEAAGGGEPPAVPHPADAAQCPACGAGLRYDERSYAHLGMYACPACGRRRPEPEVRLVGMEGAGLAGSRLLIALPGGEVNVEARLGGLYNAYNVLAATAAGWALGVPAAALRDAVAGHAASFGRQERVRLGDKEALLLLVKNPVGLSQALAGVLGEPGDGKVLLLGLNDLAADGRDVSWIWDADLEQLARRAGAWSRVVVAGLRAEDMALRLKYAGVSSERVDVVPGLDEALRAALERVPAGGRLYLLPTYTALLGLRRRISRLGYAPRYWEV